LQWVLYVHARRVLWLSALSSKQLADLVDNLINKHPDLKEVNKLTLFIFESNINTMQSVSTHVSPLMLWVPCMIFILRETRTAVREWACCIVTVSFIGGGNQSTWRKLKHIMFNKLTLFIFESNINTMQSVSTHVSPLMLWVRIALRRGVLNTTLCA
jgi:hypothetical protein